MVRYTSVLFIIIFCLLAFPRQIFAHAVLIEASPAADSRIEESPEEITLTFNEEVKEGLYSLKVINQERETVSDDKPQLSSDHKQIRLKMPELEDGAYLVTYDVVSADGHPVHGSFVFLMGDAPLPQDGEWEAEEFDSRQLGIHLTRAVYYLALLCTTGWILWKNVSSIYSEKVHKIHRSAALLLQQFHFLCLIALIIVQWLMNTASPGIPVYTGFGLSWLVSLVLSLLGFIILFRSKWLDITWVLLMLAAKSLNGHASSYGLQWVTIPANFLHLLAGAIWAGGLLHIILFWHRHRLHLKEFIPLFSKAAFLSFIVLFLTGVLSIFSILPNIEYLWVTPWGILLLVKILFVFIVICVAGKVRSILKNKAISDARFWLRADFSLMIIITIIAGSLSYINPIPANTPLNWKEITDTMDMTLTISPKTPGENRFELRTANENSVKRAELWLVYEDQEEIAPIQVPLTSNKNGSFSAEGYYLPFHGEWMAELKLIDKNSKESLFKKRFRVFEANETTNK